MDISDLTSNFNDDQALKSFCFNISSIKIYAKND